MPARPALLIMTKRDACDNLADTRCMHCISSAGQKEQIAHDLADGKMV